METETQNAKSMLIENAIRLIPTDESKSTIKYAALRFDKWIHDNNWLYVKEQSRYRKRLSPRKKRYYRFEYKTTSELFDIFFKSLN